jgi:pyrimidine oxygenase
MDIGIFLPTGTRGYLVSATAPLNDPTWELNRRVVEMAEGFGCEFALSMVKFRGFGGESQFWDGALEPFTLIAALAAVTKRIRLQSTAASLAMPPAIVARMAATMDQIAPGRIGINLVTGWQKAEYDQMGLWPGEVHFERRYDMVGEYARILRELWTTGRSDFRGEFFTMKDCRLIPQPRNKIDLVVAGSSDRGMEFAAQYCDYNFCSAPDTINQPEACEGTVARLHAAAERHRSAIKALVWVSVVADETDALAEAKWARYRDGTDLAALGWRREQAAEDRRNKDPHSTAQRNQAPNPGPVAGCKIIGSYATVARHLDRLAAIPGLAGAMLSFDDFLIGTEQFGTRIQPLMASRAHAVARVAAE